MSTYVIKYLRHGTIATGGARHEEFFWNALTHQISARKKYVISNKKVAKGIFKSWQNVLLLIWGFIQADADLNIVVGRLALPSILRNLFSHSKTMIVLHNFDEQDAKGKLLKYYYKILFYVLRQFPSKRISIVVVSPYFYQYFTTKFPKIPVFLFPNLFDTAYYNTFKQDRNPNKILLGQYSKKMDPSIFKLAALLHQEGYQCFFCTLRQEEAAQHEHYEIKKLSFEDYLNAMASSYCSLSLSGVKEGWPRMVHESLLVGTPVIGFQTGGLGDLLMASNSYIVHDAYEAFHLIKEGNLKLNLPLDFVNKYDISASTAFLEPIINYLE